MPDHDRPGAVIPTTQTLLERARRLAGPPRDHHDAHQATLQQRNQVILELDDAEVPIGEIAAATGLGRTQVYRIIEREHIRRRRAADAAADVG